MPPHLPALAIFSWVIGLTLTVFFTILFFRKDNTLSNKMLGVLILIGGLAPIINPVIYLGGFADHIFWFYVSTCTAYCFGPCLILYLHLMEGNAYHFKKQHLLHFFPVLLILLYGGYIAIQPADARAHNYERILAGNDLAVNVIFMGQFTHFGVYITWGIYRVKRYRKRIEHFLTSYDEVNYNWMWFFVTRLLVLNTLVLLLYALQFAFLPHYQVYSELVVAPLATLAFYAIVFYQSFSNHLVFDRESFKTLLEKNRPLLNISVEENKKETIPENPEQLNAVKTQLDKLLNEDKAFTIPQLSIQQLANQIGCGRTALSLTINRMYGITFFELINNYRIQEAKKLLTNPAYYHLKIDAIGKMAGFNSRAGFFSVFKKTTGLTPSQFRKLKAKEV